MSYILDLYAIQKFVHILAERSQLTVKYTNKVDMACTDGKVIYVPTPNYEWSDEEYTKWLYAVYHEIGHNVPEMRDCFDIQKKNKINMQSFLGVCLNLLEDYRQEYYKYDEYDGKRKIIERGREICLKERLKDLSTITKRDKHTDAIITLFGWETQVRTDWQPSLIGIDTAIYDSFNEQQNKWLEKLLSGPYKKLLNNIDNAEDTLNLTEKIIKEVFEFDLNEERKNSKIPSKGEGEDASEGKTKGQGKGTDKEKGKKSEEGKEIRTEEGKVKYDDLLLHKHGDSTKKATYTPIEIDYEGSSKKDLEYEPYTFNDFKVYDYSKIPTESSPFYDDEINTNTTNFSNKLKRYLMISSKDKYEYGKKKGYLHNKNLYRVSVPNSGSQAEKVFKQKRQSSILDAAVLVLIDMSGSMGGRKIINAGHSTILLNDAIAKLTVPVEISGFTDKGPTTPVYNVLKYFDSKVDNEILKKRFITSINNGMADNPDGDAILFAYNRIKQRKEKKKIMIVLSDGQPLTHRGHGCYAYTQEVVSKIEKEGVVDIYGLGICTDAVRNFYSNNRSINDASELEAALFDVLKDKLLNRGN